VVVERSGDQVVDWSRRPLVIRILAGVFVLGLVLVAVATLVLPRFDGDDDSAERNAVISRASDFAAAYNTYDVADLADYQKRLKGLLTPSYDREFVKITDAVFGALKDKKQRSGDAKLQGVAIDSIDDDSATAIVAVDSKITNTDNPAAVERRFRWKVTFSKVKGEWRVSNFESVASVDAQTAPATSAPAPAATTPAPEPAPTTPAPTDGTSGGDAQ
jgi:Mce-associated membrane protein